MKTRTSVFIAVSAALLGGCVTGNDFMTRDHKDHEYRWIADIQLDGGTGGDCGAFFHRATMRIKDNILTIWPYTGYQSQEWALDLKGLNPDGSGRVESSYAEDETADRQAILHKVTFHFDPGVGPRRMIQHTNYGARCSWTWTPEDLKPTGRIIPTPATNADGTIVKPTAPTAAPPTTVFQPTPKGQ